MNGQSSDCLRDRATYMDCNLTRDLRSPTMPVSATSRRALVGRLAVEKTSILLTNSGSSANSELSTMSTCIDLVVGALDRGIMRSQECIGDSVAIRPSQ